MTEKIRDLATADIPGSDYFIRIELWNRYGHAYEHIHRYNEYHVQILRKDGKHGGWELPDVNAATLDGAKQDIEQLAAQFGFTGTLEWKDVIQ